jgi:hypothetical protein
MPKLHGVTLQKMVYFKAFITSGIEQMGDGTRSINKIIRNVHKIFAAKQKQEANKPIESVATYFPHEQQ